MFNKKANMEAMIAFWNWFETNESWIIEKSKTDGMAVVEAVDKHITPIFPYFKKEGIEFELGYNEGQGEFFFFDLNNKRLNRDAQQLSALMPQSIRNRWNFIIEH